MRLKCYLFVLSLLFVFPMVASEVNQDISVSIDEDFTAYINHSFPVDSFRYSGLDIDMSIFSDYDYVLLGAHDEIGKINIEANIEKDIVSLDFRDEKRKKVTLEFEVSPVYNSPVFLSYKLPIYDNEKNPNFKVVLSENLEIISTNPIALSLDPIKIDIPQNKDISIVDLYVAKKNVDRRYVKKEIGYFNVYGKKDVVNRTIEAVEDITYLEDMYYSLLGHFNTHNINIVILDVDDSKFDVSAVAESPNIILIEEEVILDENKSLKNIERIIVHEITHLVIKDLFAGEESYAHWLREGVPTFFESYAMERYYNITDYWIEESDDGVRFIENDKLFTEEELVNRYKGEFYFQRPEIEERIDDFYLHSGLVFHNFYLQVGEAGFQELYSGLRYWDHFDEGCTDCDTKYIINLMKDISNMTKDELLFPYKDSESFSEEVKLITKKEYTPEKIDKIFEEYWAGELGEGYVEEKSEEEKAKEEKLYDSIALGIVILGLLSPILLIIIIVMIIRKIRKRKLQ